MTRLDPRIGAAVLAVLGLGYMIGSLASGRSARAEPPPDLSAAAGEAGLDVWQAVNLLLDGAALVDVRTPDEHARWHAPGAVSMPAAGPAAVRPLLGRRAVILMAARDDAAQRLAGTLRSEDKSARVFYLVDGPRAWYLALELPVPLFAEAGPPRGYDQALATLKAWLNRPDAAARGPAVAALQTLAKAGYQPALLKTGGKAKPAGGARKKIAGGCG
ncbi:MAG TPA: rhodanese-like domain-containing protein [Polyangia bacterium]|jgi:rhodanese-related sulfurtransferase